MENWEGEDLEFLGLEAESFAHYYAIYDAVVPAMQRVDPTIDYPSARAKGQALLQDPRVLNRVKQIRADRDKRLGISGDKILLELARVAFHDPYMALNPQSGEEMAILQMHPDAAVCVGINLNHRLKALELLGKAKKLFTDVHEHTGGVVLKTNVPDDVQE